MKFIKRKKNNAVLIEKHELDLGHRVKHDWKFILLIFFGLILVVFAFDGYILYQVNQGNFFSSDSAGNYSGTSDLDRKTLIDASNFFQARQSEYENFKYLELPEIDPSL